MTVVEPSLSVWTGMMDDVWADRARDLAMVGRDRELRALRDLVGAGSPRAAAVVVAGDAGVGKSRLLTEFLATLQQDGWRLLVGHCLDFGDTAMPYLPFTEMLRRLDEQASDISAELAAAHPALVQLSHTQRGATTPADGIGRAEVFASMHACIEDLAARGPLAVLVEDVHWADPSSRDLITYLLRRGFTGPVALIVSYRSDDLHRRHPLRGTLAEWSRLPGVERFALTGLATGDVRRLIDEIARGADAPAYATDVARIIERAGGNPFYVEELVGAFLSGGWSLPEDLADLLLVRLDRLDDDARTLVRETSVGGQRVPHDLLAAVSALTTRELDSALRIALDQNVLVRVGEDSYAFRHALLGEAVYDDLLPGERQRLHKAYAAAIRERGRPAPGALARHAQASHDYPTALLASIEAGERAMVVGGPEEAARHYQTALELYDRAAHELSDPPDLIALVGAAGEAISVSGHPLRALGVVGEHLDALPADTAPVDRARLLLAQARVALGTESGLDLLALTAEALELIGEEETELRARLLTVRAWGFIVADDFAAARESADEALQLAARLDLFDLASDARLVLGRLNSFADMGDAARAELHTVLTDARARSDFDAELAATYRLASLHYDYAEHEDACRMWDLAADLGRERGRPWAPFAFDARLMGGVVRYVTGDWDGALERTDARAETPPQTLRVLLDCVGMLVAAGRGQTDALAGLAAARERWQRDGLIGVLSGAASIDLRAQRDGMTGALAAYEDICEVLSEQWEPTFEARVRLAALALDAVITGAANASAAELSDLVVTADRLREDARAVVDAFASHDRHFGIEGQAWWCRVDASAEHVTWLGGSRSDADVLIASWQRAVAGFERFGQPYEAARCRRRLVEVLRAAGRAEIADAEVASVRQTAERLCARPLLDWAASQGAPAQPQPGGPALTRRELEILALVAEGRTNGQIAKQLFISTKTVSVHVSNILAKLGAAGRTEAAAIARRDDLL